MNTPNDTASVEQAGFSLKPPRIEPATRRAELLAVLDRANELLAGSAVTASGRLLVAEARHDDDYHYFLQIRSEPLRGLEGWELRFDMPVRNTGRRGIAQAAEDVVDRANHLSTLGPALAAELRRAKRAVVRTVADFNNPLAPVELVALGIVGYASGSDVTMVADVRILGENLEHGIDRVKADDAEQLVSKVAELLLLHSKRGELLSTLREAGSRCLVDKVASLLMETAGMDRSFVFEQLQAQHELEFYFGGVEAVDYTGTLYWDDGVLRGDFERFNPPLRLQYGTLLMPGGLLPATVLTAAAGRRIGDLIDHPLLSADSLITEVIDQDDWTYLHLEVPTAALPAGEG